MGLTKENLVRTVDVADLDEPLTTNLDDENWFFSDKTSFNTVDDFGMDLGNFNAHPCIHLRASAKFAARATKCVGKKYGYVCKWTGITTSLAWFVFLAVSII